MHLRTAAPTTLGSRWLGTWGSVHRRLAIVDPTPAGHEPMFHERGWGLTYNGEVFNHLELREALPQRVYKGGSDAESLLHALACPG